MSEENKMKPHVHVTTGRKETKNKKDNLSKNKIIENVVSVTSIHQFADSLHETGDDGKYGYDWYFIKFAPMLNGEPSYDAHWAGTRQNVDGVSWYVGQGRVALYYVDSYLLQVYMKSENAENFKHVQRIKFAPEAINNEQTHTSGYSYNIGGSVGFTGGKDGGETQALGSVTVSGGYTYSDEVSVIVRDCNCSAYTGGENPTLISWLYDFKDPHGKFQKIEGVPDLSHSTFSPVNYLIWRIPTIYRQEFKSFVTAVQVNVASIITRYSGSQFAKIIKSPSEEIESFNVDLPYPPLLCAEELFVQVDKDGGTKQLSLMTEYDELTIEVKELTNGEEENEKPENGGEENKKPENGGEENKKPENGEGENKKVEWVQTKLINSRTEHSVLEITVDSMDKIADASRSCEIIITGKNKKELAAYQADAADVESIQIIVSQFKKLA